LIDWKKSEGENHEKNIWETKKTSRHIGTNSMGLQKRMGMGQGKGLCTQACNNQKPKGISDLSGGGGLRVEKNERLKGFLGKQKEFLVGPLGHARG